MQLMPYGYPSRRSTMNSCRCRGFHRCSFFSPRQAGCHAGLPAITVRCGFSKDRRPVGLQIIGELLADAAALMAATAIERILP
jgi:hypothetical protein